MTEELLAPVHPGEILKEDFLMSLGLSPDDLADELHLPHDYIRKLADCRD